MRASWRQKLLSAAVLLAALALIGAGLLLKHAVYGAEDFQQAAPAPIGAPIPGMPPGLVSLPGPGQPGGATPPERKATLISDATLVENTTFSGFERIGDKLFYTYDPTQAQGKQTCPT
jgi:hypothetical protein